MASGGLAKVPIPVLTEKEPKDRLAEFYRKLGWDGVSCLEPDLVRLTEEDWLDLLWAEFNHATAVVTNLSEIDACVGIGIMWANIGPSGDGQTPGMVELHSGWTRPWPGGPKLREMS